MSDALGLFCSGKEDFFVDIVRSFSLISVKSPAIPDINKYALYSLDVRP